MMTPEEKDKLDGFAKMTMDASIRGRKALLVLLFVDLIAFFGYWNCKNNSWADLRHDEIHRLYDSCHGDDDSVKKNFYKVINEPQFRDIKSIQAIKNIHDLEDIHSIYQGLERDSYTIKIPTIGTTIDANDFGIFSGAVFSCLLLFIWYCLDTEKKNIVRTLSEAYNIGELSYYYHYLAMGQVFSIPQEVVPTLINKDPSFKSLEDEVNMEIKSVFNERNPHFLRLMTRYVMYIPFIVQLLIFINDIKTIEYGLSISYSATILYIILSGLVTISTCWLLIMNFSMSRKINKIWDAYKTIV